MRVLWLAFLALSPVLLALVWFQHEDAPYADGRLACPPLPSALVRRADPGPPETPKPLAMVAITPSVPPPTAAKMQVVEPQPRNESLAALRSADREEWGILRVPQAPPVVLASVPPPTAVAPAVAPEPAPPVAPEPVPLPPPAPNLYLPEGAVDEEGAQLTLIKAELKVFGQPDAAGEPAPFALKDGDRVRPLTRLRNASDFDWVKFERDGKEWWAQAEYFIRIDPRNQTDVAQRNLEVGREAVGKDSALPPGYAPDDLVALPHSVQLDQRDIRVRREVAAAVEAMCRAASKSRLKLRVFSGYRDFDYQKKLYLEAIEKEGPKQNSTAPPGYSEHQLGTTIDVSNADKRFVLSGKFGDTPEGKWLYENVEKFGFRHSYTAENTDQAGYKPEPWHIRFMGVGGGGKPEDGSGTAVAKK
jgi:zinc D-Ala-D-Ala carboxypeptidase